MTNLFSIKAHSLDNFFITSLSMYLNCAFLFVNKRMYMLLSSLHSIAKTLRSLKTLSMAANLSNLSPGYSEISMAMTISLNNFTNPKLFQSHTNSTKIEKYK